MSSSPTTMAFRIRLVDRPAADERALAIVGEPRRFSIMESVALDVLPPPSVEVDLDGFYLLSMPGGAAVPLETRQWAEAWISGDEETDGAIELLVQSDRILWRPGRAVVIAAADRLDQYLPGLISFGYFESELRRLERDVESWGRAAERDVDLTRQVNVAALRRWPQVNEMTEAVTRARMRHVAISGPLEKPPRQLPGPARRLTVELAVQAETASRLEQLDDQLEVLEDLYELANDRLAEFSYFRSEWRLEWLIVAMLGIEAVLLLLDFLRH